MRRILSVRSLSCIAAGSIMLLSPLRLPAQAGAAAAKADNSAVHVLGLVEVKRNTKGQIDIEAGALHFKAKAGHAAVPLASIKDIDSGEETKATGGTVGSVARMAVPYGGGRALSLLMRARVDVLTLQYQNDTGALHGVILSLPKGQGEALKSKLVAQGAHIPSPANAPKSAPTGASSAPPPGKDQPAPKITASAIQVEPIDAGEMDLPADFRVAIYENLIEQLRLTGSFKEVYRSGDRRADAVPDLVKLRTTLVKFQEGSQTKRQVTTVAGATKIEVRAQAIGRDGRPALDRQVRGQVRFFGDNLRATLDLARSIAKLFGKTV